MHLKGAGSRNVNKLLRNNDLALSLIGHTEIFNHFSKSEGVILEMDSWIPGGGGGT